MDNEDINIIKTLSYISSINKSKKQMNLLLKEKMKNLEVNYKEEQKQIEYISWKIDNYDNKLNKEIENAKYIVEMRKNNENLIKVYEGNVKCWQNW